jgi:hypothetical protein
VDASFLEQLIEKHDLVVWNDEQATFHREGCHNHSIVRVKREGRCQQEIGKDERAKEKGLR